MFGERDWKEVAVRFVILATAALVVFVSDTNPPASMSVLTYLGIGFGILTLVFDIYDVLDVLRG